MLPACSCIGPFPLQELQSHFTGPWSLVRVIIAGTSLKDNLLELLRGQNESLPRVMYSVWPRKNSWVGLEVNLMLIGVAYVACVTSWSKLSHNDYRAMETVADWLGHLQSPVGPMKVLLCNGDTTAERTEWEDLPVKFPPPKFYLFLNGNRTHDNCTAHPTVEKEEKNDILYV